MRDIQVTSQDPLERAELEAIAAPENKALYKEKVTGLEFRTASGRVHVIAG